MKKHIIILLILINQLFALQISQSEVKNANSLIVQLEEKNIQEAEAIFNKKSYAFTQNPFFSHKFFVLLPTSYYQAFKKYPLKIRYKKEDGTTVSETLNIKVVDGNYKSEVIKVSKSKVKPNKKNQQRVKKERDEALTIYKSFTPKLLWKEEFINPLKSKITSNFGNKRIYNDVIKSFHGGTDFRAAIGTPLKAVNDGIIRLAKDRYYAGGSVIIDHGQGVYSCYYHLSKFKVKAGEKVKKGQIIGLSGNTGRVTGPHLHFSMWVKGTLVDPLQLISTLNSLKK